MFSKNAGPHLRITLHCRRLPFLTSLNLGNNTNGGNEYAVLCRLIDALASSLEILHIHDCRISDEGLVEIGKKLVTVSGLEKVSITKIITDWRANGGDFDGDSLCDFFNLIPNFTRLKYLEVFRKHASTAADDAVQEAVARSLSQNTSLVEIAYLDSAVKGKIPQRNTVLSCFEQMGSAL